VGVATSAVLDAPIEAVWAIVSDFGNLQRWHPMVARCEADGDAVGSMRTVHFADWWASERLERLDPQAHVFGYAVVDSSRPPNIGVNGSITLSEAGPGRTRVDWMSGHPDDHPHAAVVNPALEAYYPQRVNHLRNALGLPIIDA